MKRSVYTAGSLIILLIAAFIFVLVPMLAGGRGGTQSPAFGMYKGKSIRYEQGSDLYNYVTNYVNSMKNYGIEVNSSDYYDIFDRAFKYTVSRLVYSDVVEKSGWSVPKSALNRTMMEYFKDENGKYSQKLYRSADPQRVADLYTALQNSLISQRYADDMFGSKDTLGKDSLYGIKTSEKEEKFILGLNAKKAFVSASFDMEQYPDSEKEAFGKENSQKFIEYDFSVITFNSKEKAEAAAKRIANEEITFSDAVNEYSQKTYSDEEGKLRNQFYYQLENIIVNADDLKVITSLEDQKVSSPVQTTIGFSIFKSDGKAVEPDFSDSSVLKAVFNYIKDKEFSHIENFYTSKAENFISFANENSFEAACKEFEIEKKEIAEFPLNYGSLEIMDRLVIKDFGMFGADTNENFLKTAFSLKENEISKPITINKTIIILKAVDGMSLSEQEPAALEGNTDSEEQKITPEKIAEALKRYDSSYAEEKVLSNPDFKNNFKEVYYKYFTGSN